jgi:hypothetical protein
MPPKKHNMIPITNQTVITFLSLTFSSFARKYDKYESAINEIRFNVLFTLYQTSGELVTDNVTIPTKIILIIINLLKIGPTAGVSNLFPIMSITRMQ